MATPEAEGRGTEPRKAVSLGKRLRRGVAARVFIPIAGLLFALYLKTLVRTCRIKVVERGAALPVPGALYAIWHEHFAAVSSALTALGIRESFMSSWAPAGALIARTGMSLGWSPVRGSQRSGGKKAREEMIELVKSGRSVVLTVDGSSGPRRVTKPGIVDAAIVAGAPIVPVTAIASSRWVANTWDQMKIPRPFSTLTVIVGKPIVPTGPDARAQFETLRAEVDARLNGLEDDAPPA